MRRFSVCVAIGLSLLLPAQVPAGERFPYEAEVAADAVEVRSGPGTQKYYATSMLDRGQKVKVLRQAVGGWLAIEPPAGSYSYVDADKVEITKDGQGVVTENNVVVRIGSEDGTSYDILARVQLHHNDKVTVVGRVNGGQLLQIEPVRGEERWIHGRHLRSTSVIKQAAGERVTSAKTSKPTPKEALVKAPEAAAPKQAKAKADAPQVAAKPRSTSVVRKHVAPAEPRDPAADLVAQADYLLAQTEERHIRQWDLAPIRDRYERAANQAWNGSVRLAAQHGVNRVVQYEKLQENFTAFHQAKAEQDEALRRAAKAEAERPRYDGTGILTRAGLHGVGAPEFKLTDADGRVICYVSPALGADLRRYVGQSVGIVGTTQYRSELRTQHVTAREVVVLSPGVSVAQSHSRRPAASISGRYRPRY